MSQMFSGALLFPRASWKGDSFQVCVWGGASPERVVTSCWRTGCLRDAGNHVPTMYRTEPALSRAPNGMTRNTDSPLAVGTQQALRRTKTRSCEETLIVLWAIPFAFQDPVALPNIASPQFPVKWGTGTTSKSVVKVKCNHVCQASGRHRH